MKTQSEVSYRRKQNDRLAELTEQEERAEEARALARGRFNREYPAYGFTGIEHGNEVYDKVLEQLRKDFEPKYKEDFEK